MSALMDALHSLNAQELRTGAPTEYSAERGRAAHEALAHLLGDDVSLEAVCLAFAKLAQSHAPMVGVSPQIYLGFRMFALGVRAQEIYEAELRVQQAA